MGGLLCDSRPCTTRRSGVASVRREEQGAWSIGAPARVDGATSRRQEEDGGRPPDEGREGEARCSKRRLARMNGEFNDNDDLSDFSKQTY